mmetsp:Transcript_28965/g.85684  ORF Transcript_28965/g.85684 Transcript_28965/m.85684 type:complete len:268 (-) Transcript_28965:661-1464(-)
MSPRTSRAAPSPSCTRIRTTTVTTTSRTSTTRRRRRPCRGTASARPSAAVRSRVSRTSSARSGRRRGSRSLRSSRPGRTSLRGSSRSGRSITFPATTFPRSSASTTPSSTPRTPRRWPSRGTASPWRGQTPRPRTSCWTCERRGSPSRRRRSRGSVSPSCTCTSTASSTATSVRTTLGSSGAGGSSSVSGGPSRSASRPTPTGASITLPSRSWWRSSGRRWGRSPSRPVSFRSPPRRPTIFGRTASSCMRLSPASPSRHTPVGASAR